MTKIISRPEDQPAGEGAFTVRMDFEELQYIAALLWNTRLGDGVYQEAAYKLTETMEELFGDTFTEESSDAVNMSITVEDNRGNAIDQYHNTNIVIEV